MINGFYDENSGLREKLGSFLHQSGIHAAANGFVHTNERDGCAMERHD